MPVNSGKEWTFNTVSSLYDRIRPGYPDELYRALFAYAPLDDSGHAVEIGIGAGQAALPVLETGCTLAAVEYGDQLAQLCREKFSGYPRFSDGYRRRKLHSHALKLASLFSCKHRLSFLTCLLYAGLSCPSSLNT